MSTSGEYQGTATVGLTVVTLNDTYHQGGYNIEPPANVTPGGSSETDDRQHLYINSDNLGQMLWIFVGPIILILGLCGNTLILVIMGRKKFIGTSTSTYLRLMAVADVLVLLTGIIPEWLEACDVLVFKKLHPATCKLEKFLHYTSGDTSIWILVTFTIDRMIAINCPLNKKGCCLPSRAKYNVLMILLLTMCKNVHVFWTRGAEYDPILEHVNGTNITSFKLWSNCGRPTPQFKHFSKFVRPWIAFTFVSVLPFAAIIFCNIMIIRALIQVRHMHKSQQIQRANDKTLIQMSCMCLSASFAFLLCITPSIVLLIGKPYWTKEPNPAYDFAKAINNQLVYVNHSINFFLYCFSGKRFRQELVILCKRGGDYPVSEAPSDATRITNHRSTTTNSCATPKGNLAKKHLSNAKNGLNLNRSGVKYSKVEVCSAESTV